MITAAKCSLVIMGACDSVTELRGLSGGPPVVGFFSGNDNVTPGDWMLYAAFAFIFSLVGISYKKEEWSDFEPREVRQCGHATLGEALKAANDMMFMRKFAGMVATYQAHHYNWPIGNTDDSVRLLQGDPNMLLVP